MDKVIRCAVVVFGLLVAGRVYAADVYSIDPVHSSLGFTVKHLMVSTVPGTFDDLQGTITYDPAVSADFKADVSVQAASVNTRNSKRDDHLRSPDFFDAAKFPTITFVAKSLTGAEGKYTLAGDLTLKGVTKEVSIPVTIEGPAKGMKGESIIGLSGQLTINRQDYGVIWNKALDNGGVAVSNDVNISINIEAHSK